jgi:hypothetical protein
LEAGLLDLSTKTAFAGSWASQSEIILSDYNYLENLPETGTPRFVFATSYLACPVPLRARRARWRESAGGSAHRGASSPPVSSSTGISCLHYESDRADDPRSEERGGGLRDLQAIPAGVVPGRDQRAAILNAILIDERCRDMLYPTITPVNTFRVVFNCYFGTRLELAADDVFVSPWPRYFEYRFDLLPPEPD